MNKNSLEILFSYFRNGQFNVDYELALRTTGYLHSETQYGPIASAFNSLGYINRMLRGTIYYQDMKDYMQALVSKGTPALYTNDLWNNKWDDGVDEDYNYVMRQKIILDAACQYELQECRDEAEKRFNSWLTAPYFDSE